MDLLEGLTDQLLELLDYSKGLGDWGMNVLEVWLCLFLGKSYQIVLNLELLRRVVELGGYFENVWTGGHIVDQELMVDCLDVVLVVVFFYDLLVVGQFLPIDDQRQGGEDD